MNRLLLLLLPVFSAALLTIPAHALVDDNTNGLSDLWEKLHNNNQLFDPQNPDHAPTAPAWPVLVPFIQSEFPPAQRPGFISAGLPLANKSIYGDAKVFQTSQTPSPAPSALRTTGSVPNGTRLRPFSSKKLAGKPVVVWFESVTGQACLTDFPLHVSATSKRRFQATMRANRAALIRSSPSGHSVLFDDLLPGLVPVLHSPDEATTLLDHRKFNGTGLAGLYARRWGIELKSRDSKTTMNMEFFAIRSPEMAHGTLLMSMIANNLVRHMMRSAARKAGKPVWQMSFKGTLDLVPSSHQSFRPYAGKPVGRTAGSNDLLETCATKLINVRPFRTEPRAVKRRPRNHPLPGAPRHECEGIFHRSRYFRKSAQPRAIRVCPH